jgi:DNA-binding Lrp family transcriptional regulator
MTKRVQSVCKVSYFWAVFRTNCASGGAQVHGSTTLDRFDLRLLAALEEDGRFTNQALGDRIGLSASQCSGRRAALEAAGLIAGYRAELDAEALGLKVLAFVEVNLGTHSAEIGPLAARAQYTARR